MVHDFMLTKLRCAVFLAEMLAPGLAEGLARLPSQGTAATMIASDLLVRSSRLAIKARLLALPSPINSQIGSGDSSKGVLP
jgi:hypothetical protein